LQDRRAAAHQRRHAQNQPHYHRIHLHRRRPVPYIANDLLTIKRNDFTKVTKRKPESYSQSRENRPEVPHPGFATKLLANAAG
jgi:hypothetical protein